MVSRASEQEENKASAGLLRDEPGMHMAGTCAPTHTSPDGAHFLRMRREVPAPSETSLGHVKSRRAAPHVTTGACERAERSQWGPCGHRSQVHTNEQRPQWGPCGHRSQVHTNERRPQWGPCGHRSQAWSKGTGEEPQAETAGPGGHLPDGPVLQELYKMSYFFQH